MKIYNLDEVFSHPVYDELEERLMLLQSIVRLSGKDMGAWDGVYPGFCEWVGDNIPRTINHAGVCFAHMYSIHRDKGWATDATYLLRFRCDKRWGPVPCLLYEYSRVRFAGAGKFTTDIDGVTRAFSHASFNFFKIIPKDEVIERVER